jgi:tetratricopeptide (TPR) repeat protein
MAVQDQRAGLPPERDGDLQEEIAKYEELLAQDPRSRAFALLAEAYRKSGRHDNAIHVAQAGLRNHPYYLSGRVALARAYFDAEMREAARQEFEKVIAAAPDNLMAHRHLAEIYLAEGKATEAAKSLKMVILLDPRDEATRLKLAGIGEQMTGRGPSPAARGGAPAETPPGIPPPPAAAAPPPEHAAEPVPPAADTAARITAAAPPPEPAPEPVPPAADVVAPIAPAEPPPPMVRWEPEEEGPPAGEILEAEELPPSPPPAGEEVPGVMTVAPNRPAAEEMPGFLEMADLVTSGEEPAAEPEWEMAEQPYPEAERDSAEEPYTEEGAGPGGSTGDPWVEVDDEPLPATETPRDEMDTATLADIYLQQGFHQKAEEIYRRILQDQPGNEGIRRKLEEVSRLLGPTVPPTDSPWEGTTGPSPVSAAPPRETFVAAEAVPAGGNAAADRETGHTKIATLTEWLARARAMKRWT